jgi:hypothetical protein
MGQGQGGEEVEVAVRLRIGVGAETGAEVGLLEGEGKKVEWELTMHN